MNEWVRGKDENLWIYWMSYRDKDLIREWVSEWVSELEVILIMIEVMSKCKGNEDNKNNNNNWIIIE